MRKWIRIEFFTLLLATCPLLSTPALAGDAIDAAIADPTRSEADRERDPRSRPEVTLRLLDLAAGQQVIDLFAGGGYYTQLLAQLVGGDGKVVAYNNPPYTSFAGSKLNERLAADSMPQVQPYEATVAKFTQPDASIDRAIMIMSYHDLYWSSEQYNWPKMDADAFLARVATALKPGGKVLVVDHAALEGTGADAVAALHRIEEQFLVEHFARHGLVLKDSSDVLRNPEDPRDVSMGDDTVRGKTDRFVLLFEKGA